MPQRHFAMRSLLPPIFMLLLMSACSVPYVESFEVDEPVEKDDDDDKATGDKKKKTTPPQPGPNNPGPLPPDSSNNDGRWVGLLRSTSTVNFGGSGYCNYSMRMEDVRMQLTVDSSGGVLNVNIAATAIEESPQCQQRPIPRNVHSYDYTTTAATGARGPLTLSGSQTNEPHAKATIEVTLDGTTPHATIRWQREDTTDPLLAWVINESIPLTRTPTQ
jgi:hypothetical protein